MIVNIINYFVNDILISS